MTDYSVYAAIYAIVRQIPPGRVASYGQVALLAGLPRKARLVGYALHALRNTNPAAEVPWWRVINAAGRISNPYEAALQQALLESEGVVVDQHLRIDRSRFGWGGLVLP